MVHTDIMLDGDAVLMRLKGHFYSGYNMLIVLIDYSKIKL